MAAVDQLWPAAGEPDLERLYDYPPDLQRPYVRVNFVSSADGAVTRQGRSGGLSDPADRAVFALQRAMADVIMVGAGTARAEGYRGVRLPAEHVRLRARLGLAPVPPIAVVTGSCWLTPQHVLASDTEVAPIVITVSSAPQEHRSALAEAGVPVLIAGTDRVHVPTALQLLGRLRLHRVLCEGGPQLFGDLIATDAVDELCLTISAQLVAGPAGRVVDAAQEQGPRRLRLASVVHEDATLLLRYLRAET